MTETSTPQRGAATAYATKYLRPHQTAARLGISVATLWRWAKERDDFPSPVKLGPRVTGWSVAKLDEFDAKREEA